MEITPSSPVAPTSGITVAVPQTPGQATLAAGQQLAATVLAADGDGNVTLNIDNLILAAKSELKFTPGQLLDLLVTLKGDQLVLRLTDQAAQAAVTAQALRENLPRQMPLTDVIANLAFLAKAPTVPGQPVLAQIAQLAKQIMQNLPTSKDMSRADTLKSSLLQAGTFLEQKLKEAVSSGAAPDIEHDFKSALLQLRAALQTFERPQAARGGGSVPAAVAVEVPVATLSSGSAAAEATKAAQQNVAQQTVAQQTVVRDGKAALAREPLALKPGQPVASAPPSPSIPAPALPVVPVPAAKLAQAVVAATLVLPESGTADQAAEAKPAPVRHELAQSSAEAIRANAFGVSDSALPGARVQAQASTEPTLADPRAFADPVGELLKQVEGALARTQMHQLATLAEQDNGRLLLAFELPVKHEGHTDVIQMHIERDGRRGEGETEPPTTVTLGFDVEPLGPIYARVTLLKENVSVSLWAERPATAQLFGSHLGDLRERLEKNGLIAEHLVAHVGQPPQRYVKLDSRNLLDEKA